MSKKGWLETIKRDAFVSLDKANFLHDDKPYQLGIKTRSGRFYKTIACFETRRQAEQAYNVLSQTIKSIIRYEKKH